jgi:hypothetical protein
MKASFTSPSVTMTWSMALSSSTSVSGGTAGVGRVARQFGDARVHDDQRRRIARAAALADEGRRDRVVHRRVGADDDDHVGKLRHRRPDSKPRPSRGPPAARPPRRHGTAGCSGRRCSCRSRCAPASGRGRPPRSSPWPSRSRPARACRGSASPRAGRRRPGPAPPPSLLRGNACASRWRCRRARRPSGASVRRISGTVSRLRMARVVVTVAALDAEPAGVGRTVAAIGADNVPVA